MREFCECGNRFEYNKLIWIGEAVEEWKCQKCNKFAIKKCGEKFKERDE